jgi:integrase
MAKHSILGGKVHVYKRESSLLWQCSAYLQGKNRRVSTKTESLSEAKDFAEDWYMQLIGQHRAGNVIGEHTFKEAAKQFEQEYEALTSADRNRQYVDGHYRRIRLHLNPFFGNRGLSDVTAGLVQEYRIVRSKPDMNGKAPSRSTMHKEIVTLRQVLKVALRQGWLKSMPDLSMAYRPSGKVVHRAWFSQEEYKQLYTATRNAIENAVGKKRKWGAEQLHDYVLFMANTGLRPDEANRLQYRDVSIVDDEATNETILEIEVRGKRGYGYCKSMPGAVFPFKRLTERNKPEPDELIFKEDHRGLFNRILIEEGLKFDRDEQARTAYSLRHSYICFRLLEGADIYQIAKNCRTSVEMIEKHYASHIKDRIDTRAINVRRSIE